MEHLIEGRWQSGADHFHVCDPANGGTVTHVPQATQSDVAAAVKTARSVEDSWAFVTAGERATMLHAVADRIAAQLEPLAAATTAEMGRPLASSRDSVRAAVATVRQYAELGPLHRGRSLMGRTDALDLMLHRPRGVVAAITPWNDPVAVACGLLAAAVVTGNVVVHKPSERTPGVGYLLTRCFAEELPEGVISLVNGGPAVGAALAGAAVDVVAHVGATRTGRAIAAACAATGAKALLENGGSDPLIVDSGVDPRWAAEQAAVGAFANAGQICTAVERVYVHEAISDAFVVALLEQAGRLRMGPGTDPTTTLGPLVDVAHRDAVHAQVAASVRAGASVRCGGVAPDGPGAYYPATVLTDCTDQMAVVHEETFGPVAPVMVVRSFAEALSRAGGSPYGLAATVLTPSMGHAQQAVYELPVGTVKINAVFGGAPGGAAQPRRGSGQGFGYGPELLDELTVTKVGHICAPPPTAPDQRS
ncbi:aldehyde dehydrogenase family protein [Pilimelia columellifera subsp. columellifera]|uniref:Aldehyde dehydrogenase family protein n=1 Tax=Pilimelia columellifera subsp. columellifera TaxID=706583 RepID=A0ABN3NBN5_9ACTN